MEETLETRGLIRVGLDGRGKLGTKVREESHLKVEIEESSEGGSR